MSVRPILPRSTRGKMRRSRTVPLPIRHGVPPMVLRALPWYAAGGSHHDPCETLLCSGKLATSAQDQATMQARLEDLLRSTEDPVPVGGCWGHDEHARHGDQSEGSQVQPLLTRAALRWQARVKDGVRWNPNKAWMPGSTKRPSVRTCRRCWRCIRLWGALSHRRRPTGRDP